MIDLKGAALLPGFSHPHADRDPTRLDLDAAAPERAPTFQITSGRH
jgi:hypothetical protein